MWLLVAGRRLERLRVRTAPLDAIPDISDPQIIVYVKWPRSPRFIETEVTEPLIRALAGSPDIQSIRGTSHMGYSFVYVILRTPAREESGSSSSTASTRSGRSFQPTPRHPRAQREQHGLDLPVRAGRSGSGLTTCANCGC